MQCTNPEAKTMSFDFGSNNISQFKAGASYKDGSGMGGGGMYFQQGKKRKNEPEEDLFELSEDKRDDEITFGSELNEKDIPQDTLFNSFVNWFRKKNN